VFNGLTFTRGCLDALYRHTPNRAAGEVIVVDNGSSDGTPEFLKEAAHHYPGLKVITQNKNLGFSRACNQGAEQAKGKYLVFLNNDTKVRAGWFEPLLAVLEGDPQVAAAGGKLVFPDGRIQNAGVVTVQDPERNDPLAAKAAYCGSRADLPAANQARTYQALTAACLMVRKSCFEGVGGFDEAYWNGYEDVDLCFKLQDKGWTLVYQPKSEIVHFESQSGPERFRRIQANVQRLHQKWLGRVEPDGILARGGKVLETGSGRIKPYIPPVPN
jgi:GT2 family glycosyltransferase